MNADATKFLCLLEELETSRELIKAGFGSLQEIDMGNTFYNMAHLVMARVFVLLMKCYISLVYEGQKGSYPDEKYMKRLGHDLKALLNKICAEFYGGKTRPLIQQEFDFITTDSTLQECIRILSLFGKQGRYYNLDIVAGSSQSPINPREEWESLEASIEDIKPFLDDAESLYLDYYPRIHSHLIAKMERLTRAIALQFTIGDHVDQNGRLRQASGIYTEFRSLRGEELGTIDYRRSVRILKQEEKKLIRRSEKEIVNGEWPTRIITKAEFGKEWPFRTDRVIVECRNNMLCIVHINGYAFSLNGLAQSHLGIPCPHDAGVAVLGKSVGPFIDMAFEL
ncbi:MAG: DUF2511 domain-containing protein [Gemmatimonadetes bacterium]|nr:DUF2511 domain-containing protein [Gemmatimonadota bacterium]